MTFPSSLLNAQGGTISVPPCSSSFARRMANSGCPLMAASTLAVKIGLRVTAVSCTPVPLVPASLCSILLSIIIHLLARVAVSLAPLFDESCKFTSMRRPEFFRLKRLITAGRRLSNPRHNCHFAYRLINVQHHFTVTVRTVASEVLNRLVDVIRRQSHLRQNAPRDRVRIGAITRPCK